MPETETAQSTQAGGDAPVGQGDWVVAAGDCMSSIALASGHFWKTLWNLSENAELREARKDPNVLREGDKVHVPEIRVKEESGGTDAKHRFRRKGEPSHLELCFLEKDEPRANEPYTLTLDNGKTLEGMTDGDGKLKVPIPGDARSATLKLGKAPDQDEYKLDLGHLAPISQLAGVQARLKNMGYACEPTDEMDDKTRGAIRSFKRDQKIEPVDDRLDDATRDKIRQKHGS